MSGHLLNATSIEFRDIDEATTKEENLRCLLDQFELNFFFKYVSLYTYMYVL